ncbi:MAG: hypothetical protein ACI90V_014372, partial [Bacillariaceae sp.]|jgi:hypothetical protein
VNGMQTVKDYTNFVLIFNLYTTVFKNWAYEFIVVKFEILQDRKECTLSRAKSLFAPQTRGRKQLLLAQETPHVPLVD